MSKKKKNGNDKEVIDNYYDLKKDSVDELVAILKGEETETKEPVTTNIAEITGEKEKARGSKKSKEFDPYKRDKLQFLPTWLKAIFIKWWFAGAVCYLGMWGLGRTGEDAILLIGIILGIVVDIMVNPIFHFLESNKKEYDPYMMFPFPFKKYWTFLTNIIYYIVIVFAVNFGYLGVNTIANLVHHTTDAYYVGVEPLLFGVFCVIVDMAFIGVKDLIVFLVNRGKKDKEKEITDV